MTETTKTKNKQTLEQRRAQHAWDQVKQVASLDNKKKEEFAAHAKKMPVRILTSGLGPALAFLEAKNEAPALRGALNQWIALQKWAERTVETDKNDSSLLSLIVRGDSSFLRLATDEVMAYLQWLVRFCDAQGLKPKSD